ncbi:actin cytoskeleton and mitosis protein [Saitoella coloradoensis]
MDRALPAFTPGRGRGRGRARARGARGGGSNPGSGRNTPNLPDNDETIIEDLDSKFEDAKDQNRAGRFDEPDLAHFRDLQRRRELERADAIRKGLLQDPENPRPLDEAIKFVGTCVEMCPEFERVQRERQNNVDRLECDPETGRVSKELAVKIFHRPAAGDPPQLPSDVRPSLVLKKTLDYLVDKVLCGPHEYASVHSFVRGRTRGIRQDFTVQGVSNPVAIECHERIARFHILSSHFMCEVPEFQAQQEAEQLWKVLQTLSQFYDDAHERGEICPNEAEFKSYMILYHIRNAELPHETQDYPLELFDNPQIQLALKLASMAQRSNNVANRFTFPNAEASLHQFTRFFKLVRSERVGYLTACLLEQHFSSIRKGALKALRGSLAGKPPIAIDTLVAMLGYESPEEAAADCEHWGVEVVRDEITGGVVAAKLSKGGGWSEDGRSDPRQTFNRGIVEAKRGGLGIADVINGLWGGARTGGGNGAAGFGVRMNPLVEPFRPGEVGNAMGGGGGGGTFGGVAATAAALAPAPKTGFGGFGAFGSTSAKAATAAVTGSAFGAPNPDPFARAKMLGPKAGESTFGSVGAGVGGIGSAPAAPAPAAQTGGFSFGKAAGSTNEAPKLAGSAFGATPGAFIGFETAKLAEAKLGTPAPASGFSFGAPAPPAKAPEPAKTNASLGVSFGLTPESSPVETRPPENPAPAPAVQNGSAFGAATQMAPTPAPASVPTPEPRARRSSVVQIPLLAQKPAKPKISEAELQGILNEITRSVASKQAREYATTAFQELEERRKARKSFIDGLASEMLESLLRGAAQDVAAEERAECFRRRKDELRVVCAFQRRAHQALSRKKELAQKTEEQRKKRQAFRSALQELHRESDSVRRRKIRKSLSSMDMGQDEDAIKALQEAARKAEELWKPVDLGEVLGAAVEHAFFKADSAENVWRGLVAVTDVNSATAYWLQEKLGLQQSPEGHAWQQMRKGVQVGVDMRPFASIGDVTHVGSLIYECNAGIEDSPAKWTEERTSFHGLVRYIAEESRFAFPVLIINWVTREMSHAYLDANLHLSALCAEMGPAVSGLFVLNISTTGEADITPGLQSLAASVSARHSPSHIKRLLEERKRKKRETTPETVAAEAEKMTNGAKKPRSESKTAAIPRTPPAAIPRSVKDEKANVAPYMPNALQKLQKIMAAAKAELEEAKRLTV